MPAAGRAAVTGGSVPGVLARACTGVRGATPGDAVAGVAPRFVARPADVAEAAAVLAAASSLGMTVLPRGSGTRIGWGLPPAGCDLVVDTLGLSKVLEHASGDLVVRAQAGVRLDRLRAVLAKAGQRLALDPPPLMAGPPPDGSGPERAAAGKRAAAGTVGGIIATGAAGPLRLRYGTPRDLTIGITVVRADGTLASSGGKVVKNVAGYDLGKLFAGCYGTLGLIVEAVFRLHPRPAATSFVTCEAGDPDAAQAAVAAAAGSPLAPSAVELDRPARQAPFRVGVLLEGDPEGVAERTAAMTGLLGSGSAAARAPAWWGRGAAAAAGGTVVRVAFWAAELAGVLRAVDAAAAAAGLDPLVGGSAAAGVIHAAVGEDAGPAAVARFVQDLREAAPFGAAGGLPSRGSVVVLHAPAGVRAAVDVWGPVPSARLMRAIKDQFDPGHRMAPGRFAGGI